MQLRCVLSAATASGCNCEQGKESEGCSAGLVHCGLCQSAIVGVGRPHGFAADQIFVCLEAGARSRSHVSCDGVNWQVADHPPLEHCSGDCDVMFPAEHLHEMQEKGGYLFCEQCFTWCDDPGCQDAGTKRYKASTGLLYLCRTHAKLYKDRDAPQRCNIM